MSSPASTVQPKDLQPTSGISDVSEKSGCMCCSCGKVIKVVVLALATAAVVAAALAAFGIISGPFLPLMIAGAAGAGILLGTAIHAMITSCCVKKADPKRTDVHISKTGVGLVETPDATQASRTSPVTL